MARTEKKKNKGSVVIENAKFDTTLRSAATTEELEEIVDLQVLECVQALSDEWTALSKEIDTYDKFEKKADEVEAFHEHIVDSSEEIIQMISGYAVAYADLIMDSKSSDKDKYNSMEGVKDVFYNDACDYVRDDIYGDLLEEVRDYLYDGVVKAAKGDIDYSDWADARSDTYDWWSDARSDVYKAWSDERSDLYSFVSDVRSDLYSGDLEKAEKEIRRFEEKMAETDCL